MNSPSLSSTKSAKSSHLLEGLNASQRQAVCEKAGTLFILAGAGTGKTKVIAHRVAHLLRSNPGLSPANILALAFSKKAAQELLERVEGLLGMYADELGVFTFHGFCHRFLQDHAGELGLSSRFRLLDRVESWVFFRKLLTEFRLSVRSSLSDPSGCIDGFLRFISRAKDEFVSPREYAAFVEKISDPGERKPLEETARVYRIYQERMRAASTLDFGDLIAQTLRVLQENPKLLAQVQAQYPYILVDEFQDTNVAQIMLLRLIAGEKGNLCVVGDDDQAIYRFRGASFASFLLLKEFFPQVQHIRLTQNYRSTKRVLAAADRLIRHNEPDRYDPQKLLSTENPEGDPVEVIFCHGELSEARGVVQTIRRLTEDPRRAARLGEIAVLYRAHAHRDRLVGELRKAGIPFWISQGDSLFAHSEVKDLVAFLRILRDPTDSVNLFRLLSHPLWGIPPEDLYAIGQFAKQHGISLHKALEGGSSLAVSDSTQEVCARFRQEWKKAARHAARSSVAELVSFIAEETFLRAIFRLPKDSSEDPLLGLGRFLQWTYRYCTLHPKEQDLGSFLWTIDAILEAGGFLLEEETALDELGDRVKLMTVHQAKGLEFDWVILLSMVQGRFPSRGRTEPIPFPVELMKERLPQGDYHREEERRLCYVACTRAQKGLFLMTQERAYHRPSLFVREILEGASPEDVRCSILEKPQVEEGLESSESLREGSSLKVEGEILQLLQEIRKQPAQDEEAFSHAMERIKGLVKQLRFSAPAPQKAPRPSPLKPERFSYTQLETYRYCPMKYRYQYLYQIPVAPTAEMAFGIDLHVCLESFFRQVMNGKVPSLSELLDTFRRCCAPGRYGTSPQEEGYQRLGVEMLTHFYKKHEGAWEVPLFVEKSFLLRLGDCWIRGVVDRVDPITGGGVEILDYKSGKPKESAQPEERLQLTLYAMACAQVFHLEPKKVSFYYLRNGEKLSFKVHPEDFEGASAQVKELASGIRSGDFTPDPSLMKCRRCDFRNLCPASLAS